MFTSIYRKGLDKYLTSNNISPPVRDLFNKYVPVLGLFSSADALRRKFLPSYGKSEKDFVKLKLKNKPIVIIADETSDKKRGVFLSFYLKLLTRQLRKFF
jgi:hypothetical protein